MSSKVDKKKLLSLFEQVDETQSSTAKNLNDKVLIVDGLNTFIRAFAVNPSVNDDGLHIGGLIGFLRSVRYTCDILKPSRCIIVFDGKGGSSRRRKIYPEYKGNRKSKHKFNRHIKWGLAPENEEHAMRQQISRLVEYLEQLPVTMISIDNIEADDVMAYISQQLLPESDIMLMSTDKDFLQLVDDRVKVWSPTKKKLYNPQAVFEDFGVHSHNMLTYRVLDGDKSDNIGGVKGAGLKSLKKFCPEISSIEKFDVKDLLEFVEKSDKKIKLLENIKNSSNLIKRNYLLMQLQKVDIPKHTMRKIQQAVNRDIPTFVKYKFQTMFLKDKLSSQIKDLDTWLQEFVRLSRYKGLDSGR